MQNSETPMSGLIPTRFCFVMASFILMGGLGCGQVDVPKGVESPIESPIESGQGGQLVDRPVEFADSKLSSAEILASVVQRYAQAESYQDNAVLYLSYQLEGRQTQEPQRWSTVWQRGGKYAGSLFNGKVAANGGIISCYIFDIESENLDNQHLLRSYQNNVPFTELFSDSIAKYFLGGYSELPLDESTIDTLPSLIPPPISLLTGQLSNPWIQGSEQSIRLADEAVDGRSCYVVRSLSLDMTADIWIDRETFVIHQISLPLKLLVGEVVTSPEIKDVELLAKFHDAVFDESIPAVKFAIEDRGDATPLEKFVALPEAIPSRLIGEIVPNFQLVGDRKIPVSSEQFRGDVTAVLWLAGLSSYPSIRDFDSLARELSDKRFQFGVVYSDADVQASDSLRVVDELAAYANVENVDFYFDSATQANRLLQMNVVPSVVVIDENMRLQFAAAIGDANWKRDLKAAMVRVADGENVAEEMRLSYGRFIESYQQQLQSVSARKLLEQMQSN
ncbi:hypothetical protein N9048_00940 [bacterium]|nr:hypothetical protein [bacterium]